MVRLIESHSARVKVRRQPSGVRLSPFNIQLLGIVLKLSGLGTSVFIHWAISLPIPICSQGKIWQLTLINSLSLLPSFFTDTSTPNLLRQILATSLKNYTKNYIFGVFVTCLCVCVECMPPCMGVMKEARRGSQVLP